MAMVEAETAFEKVSVWPIILVIVPKAPLVALPTAPVNVTLPEPVPKVSELAPEAALSTVLEKLIALEVVVSVVAAPSVTAPE